MGEAVEAGGYEILVKNVTVNSDTLHVIVFLGNNTEKPIDLSHALSLYTPDGFRIAPENAERSLAPGDSLEQEFIYGLPKPVTEEQILGYRLLYTPFGWSGPVIMYLLVEKLPDVPPPPTPPEQDVPVPSTPSAGQTPEAYNGITGDPWKVLILIYPNIDTDYIENGISKHLTASMPAADLAAMRADFINNLSSSTIESGSRAHFRQGPTIAARQRVAGRENRIAIQLRSRFVSSSTPQRSGDAR